MNPHQIKQAMDEHPQIETLTVVGAAVFFIAGAAICLPLFIVWAIVIALLVKFKKPNSRSEPSDERPAE